MDPIGPRDEVQQLADGAAAVAGMDPAAVAAMPEARLGEQIAALHEVLHYAEAALAARLVPFDSQAGYAGEGAASEPQWAGRECGVDPRTEAGRLKVAHKLSRCERIGDAMVEGKLSFARAKTLVRYLPVQAPRSEEERRVEAAFHQVEAELVDLAQELTVRQCDRLIHRWYVELAPEEAEARWNEQWTRRHLHHSDGFEGTGFLDASLDVETNAIAHQALDHAYEALWRDDVAAAKAAGDPTLCRTPAQRRVDAFAEVCSGYLAAVNDKRPGRAAVPSVVATIEIDPTTSDIDRGRIGDTPVPKATIERLLCDGRLARLLTTPDSVPLDMGHDAELATPAQRKALTHRDRGCAFPGCDRPPRWCNAHHCRHREHQGRTDLDNLVLLCRHHHRLMHEAGWNCWIDPTDHRPRFRHPHGRILAPDPPDPRPPRPPERSRR